MRTSRVLAVGSAVILALATSNLGLAVGQEDGASGARRARQNDWSVAATPPAPGSPAPQAASTASVSSAIPGGLPSSAQQRLLVGNGHGSVLAPGSLIELDPTTFAGTSVGASGTDGITGLTTTPDGRLWASVRPVGGSSGFVGGCDLVELDPLTGATLSQVQITSGGVAVRVGDLATQPSTGVIYASGGRLGGAPAGELFTLDTQTGLATFVGSTGFIADGGLAFDAAGTLWATRVQASLLTIDPATATVLTEIPYFPEQSLDGLAVRPSDGALLATRGNFAGGDLIVRIDPVTGLTTNLASTGTGTASDLVFYPQCASLAAVPGVQRFGSPAHAGVLQPFSQDKILIGAGPASGIPGPDVEFLVPNPGTTILISWAFSTAPESLVLPPPLGPLLISTAPPNPIATVQGVFSLSSVLSVGAVPFSCELVGLPLYTQGGYAEADGTVSLTNAVDYVIGTH